MSKRRNEDVKIDKWVIYSKIDVREKVYWYEQNCFKIGADWDIVISSIDHQFYNTSNYSDTVCRNWHKRRVTHLNKKFFMLQLFK